MIRFARQLNDSKWIRCLFLKKSERCFEWLSFLALMSWALAAPLTLLFGDHYYTYMISATMTSLIVAYFICVKLLQWLAKESKPTNLHSGKTLFFRYPWHFFLGGMFLWSFLSFLIAAEDKLRALTGASTLKEGLTAYCFYAMLYVVATRLTEEKKRNMVLRTMLYGSLLLAALFWLSELGFTHYRYGDFGDWVFLLTQYRASIYLNSNYYGYYLTVILALIAAFYVSKTAGTKAVGKLRRTTETSYSGFLERIVLLLLFSINAVTLIVNDTLGAYIAVLLTLILIPILFSVRGGFRVRSLVPLILFLIFTICINFGIPFGWDITISTGSISRNYMSLRSDLQSILTASESASQAGSGRWVLWQAAWKLMLDKPLFGCGPEQMMMYYRSLVSIPYNWPHNEYLQYTAMLGIPAGGMYIASLISLAYTQMKRVKVVRRSTLIAGCAVFGYAVSAFFGGTTYVTAPYMFLLLGMTSLRAYERENPVAGAGKQEEP